MFVIVKVEIAYHESLSNVSDSESRDSFSSSDNEETLSAQLLSRA